MKKNLVLSIALLLLSLLVAVAPYSFAKVCEIGAKVMKCHWTARIELFLGLSIALLSALKLVNPNTNFQLGLNLGIAVNGLGVILVPTVLIGVCGMSKMHCHSVTRPVLLIFGIIILAAVTAQTVFLWKKR